MKHDELVSEFSRLWQVVRRLQDSVSRLQDRISDLEGQQ